MFPLHRVCFIAALAAVVLAGPVPVSAEENPKDPPLLTVSVEAARQLANDEMNVLMRVERESRELAEANRDALERINALLARAGKVDGVKTSLSSIRSNPVYAEVRRDENKTEKEVSGWRVHAEALLRSRDMPTLSRLIGELAADARVMSVGFTVSQQMRDQVEAELLLEAARAFNERAAAVAGALGFAGFDIERVSVGTGRMPPLYRPVAQEAMMSMRAAAAPDFSDSAGESTMSATASGQVWLRP